MLKSPVNTKFRELILEGVEVWNEWRAKNVSVSPHLTAIDLTNRDLRKISFAGVKLRLAKLDGADLSDSDLSKADLSGAKMLGARLHSSYCVGASFAQADLRKANLSRANMKDCNLQNTSLERATLEGATLDDASLNLANLCKANLGFAKLRHADLRETRLREADLQNAILTNSDFTQADLRNANLEYCELGKVTFYGTLLDETRFGGSHMLGTTLNGVDLSRVLGLEAVIHDGPSSVATATLSLSRGRISPSFLRGCGLNDWQIETSKLYDNHLASEEINSLLYRVYDLRAGRPIQISNVFISYSRLDEAFIDKLAIALDNNGIRFWLDKNDATVGRLEKQIDRAIRLYPTVLLVLSKNSVKSDWVEHEVRLGRELEKQTNRDVLCPIALDDSWKSCKWPARIRQQIMEYNIVDFSMWDKEGSFDSLFEKLHRGLHLYYKAPPNIKET
jgi:uncharacterized protein YjbI with pentapeptide repeats